jgi:hypothetical protein
MGHYGSTLIVRAEDLNATANLAQEGVSNGT